MGGSFGGFSTLTALTFTPDMFRVGIAVKPVVDMGKAIVFIKKTGKSIRRTQDIQDLFLDPTDPEALTHSYEKSPDYHSGKVTAPLYIWAGGKDQRVSLLDIKDYSLRQREADKLLTLIIAKNEGHGFNSDIALEALFYLFERALSNHLGGRIETEQSPSLKRFLKRSTIIDRNQFLACKPRCVL